MQPTTALRCDAECACTHLPPFDAYTINTARTTYKHGWWQSTACLKAAIGIWQVACGARQSVLSQLRTHQEGLRWLVRPSQGAFFQCLRCETIIQGLYILHMVEEHQVLIGQIQTKAFMVHRCMPHSTAAIFASKVHA